MKINYHSSNSRGVGEYGWLHTRYSFSFSRYFNPNRMGFGTLLVLNDDVIDGGGGFPSHSHQNMEIITVVLDGSLAHKDSTGGEGVIHACEVQVMSAGTGVAHSEFNASATKAVSLFQIWIMAEKNDLKPRYDQAVIDPEVYQNNLKLLVSPMDYDSPDTLKINQQSYISRGKFNQGKVLDYNLYNKNNLVFIILIDGQVEINGQKAYSRDSIELSEIENNQLNLTILDDADILIIETPDIPNRN